MTSREQNRCTPAMENSESGGAVVKCHQFALRSAHSNQKDEETKWKELWCVQHDHNAKGADCDWTVACKTDKWVWLLLYWSVIRASTRHRSKIICPYKGEQKPQKRRRCPVVCHGVSCTGISAAVHLVPSGGHLLHNQQKKVVQMWCSSKEVSITRGTHNSFLFKAHKQT